MTSTNDGKDVKINQTSGHKGKTYYIELYKSLEARLSGPGSLAARTGHLCDAWRRVYSLHQHSAHSTHPHLLSWLQRHTALIVLQNEWRDPKSKDEHAQLGAAIESLISEASAIAAARPAPLPWEQLLLQRAHWFRDIFENPWGHPVLERLLNPTGEPVTDEQVLEWLTMERGIVFVTRLRTLGAARDCSDLALTLASTVMERARAARPARDDQGPDTGEPEEESGPFAATLTREAGFSQDVWDLLVDIEFVLLHKRGKRAKCIDLAKQTPLRNGYHLVERLRSRPETSPRDKKLWKDAKEVATLIAQVIIARCMVVTSCTGVSRSALYCCARSLARLVAPARLPGVTAALAAPAATARHLHTLCSAIHAQCPEDMMPFVCELYIRAITAGMNELERLKDEKKQSEARQSEQMLASWFTQLGALLGGSARLKAECALTAFSVHPAHAMYERVRATPPLAPPADALDPKPEGTSEFNSWANDSRSQSNLVKTSETLQLKQGPRQANVLSSAILTEGEALGISVELGQDLVVLLSGPRVKTLLWDMDRELLLENCRAYMERTHAGTRALTTELKYLNLDPKAFQHLPEEDDDENDAYYGIEKGYEHLVQLEEPEEIWQNAFIDPEQTESAHESEIESYQLPNKKKNRGSSAEEDDPLSIISDAKKEKKRINKEKSKERRKKKSHKRDSSKDKDASKERRKDKDKKPKKERKKKKSDQPAPGSLTSLLGMKVTEMPSQVQDGEKRVRKKKERRRDVVTSRVSVTDSDYDSQGKLSQVSDTTDPNILIDVVTVDELASDIRKSDANQKVMDNASPAVRNDVAVLQKPSVTKAKKPVKIKKTPIAKTASEESDASRARSPFLALTKLPCRPVVSSKVKNSITKLLNFRRNKLKAQSVPKTPVQQSTCARTHALVGMKINNPEGPKIQMTPKQSQEIEALKNEVNNLINVADQTKSRQFVPKIPYNEAKDAGKLPGPLSAYNSEKPQNIKHIQHNTTQNVVQIPNTFRESQKALGDYMLKQSQYNNYMTNQPQRPTSVIDSSYISPSKQVDRQYATHISPPKPPANRLNTQPFHKSMQNLTNNDDLKYDQTKKHINDVNYYNQYAMTTPQHSPKIQNNACIKSPNVPQNQSPNFNSCSLQQHPAVGKAREDIIKFYHSFTDNDVRTNQSRAPQVNTQVSQSLNDDVIRHGQKHMSSLMQDPRTEKYLEETVAKWLQMPNDSRSGHASHTKTYARTHSGDPNAQRNYNTSDNKLQSQVGRIVQNPVQTSPIVRDTTPKQLNLQAQQQTPKHGMDNNFQEFLKELHKSINAGVNAKAGHSVPLNKEVKVSLVNTSMTASAKKNDLIPSSAKQLIQQKKTENAPNTFSRLSYMHKNKQSEIKHKSDALALNLELNKNIIEHKISKAKYMKNDVIISRVDKKNTIVSDKINMQTFPKTEQTSSHTQNDFPVLTSILDAKPIEKTQSKRSRRPSSTVTHSTSDNSINREHADLLLLLRNQQTFVAPKAKTNPSTFDHGPSSHTQPKVEKAQIPVATNRTYQRTDDKDIAKSFLIATKTNTDPVEADDNQQDWERVMNSLRAHKTAPLGPNALDMVLKKERKHSYGSSSSHTSGTKTVNPNSSQNKATDSMRREHHIPTSSSTSRKSSIERHAQAPKMPSQNEVIKKTPEVSKRTEVPNKHFTSNPTKQDDPFISGIRNSDYDLLEELMDDDLRQEIGELSSDEEYRAPASSVKAKTPCSDSKRNVNVCAKLADVPKEKPRIVDLKTIFSNNASDFKRMEANCTRTAVNTSSQASYTNVITRHPVTTSNLPESRPTVLCSNTKDQHTVMNVITNQTEPHHYIANIPSNTHMEQTNLIITSMPAQPLVLISQELVYDPYPTIRIHENQVNASLCSITQNAYVAVNTAPNIAVYQTTQFAAPLINPVIIGNATTTTTNVTNVFSNGNQHVKREEKPAVMNIPSPVAEDRIKDDSDKGLEKSINLDWKNNERKVLSQVQENHTSDVSDKDLRRLSADRNPLKTNQDEERLIMKRQSLMNREVKHPRHPPIPLSYTPLGKKVNVNKLPHGTPKNGTVKSKYEIISKMAADQKDTVVTSVDSPKSETNNENIENPSKILSAKEKNEVCRRILLRSSNTLENKLTSPCKDVRIPLRKNKIKLEVAELAAKIASSSDVQKKNDKTTKEKITRKRISKRLMEKKVKDETTELNTAISLETNKNQEVSVKNVDSKEVPNLEFIDIEDELSGSKILKIPPKTNNAQQDLEKDAEKKAETQTVVENILQGNNKLPVFLGNTKTTPIQNTAVPTVLIEKLKHNLGDQLIIKSTSVIKSSKQPIVMTIKNKNETVLSINTKEPPKQVCDKLDSTIVKAAVETKAISKLPAVPALHIKLNSTGPVIINDKKLNVKTTQPESVAVDENKMKVKTTEPEPVVIDKNKVKVTKTHPEPVVIDENKIKVTTTPPEPVVVDNNQLTAKIKQPESVAVDDNKRMAKALKSESAVTGHEKLDVNIKQTEPVTVVNNKIKTKGTQSEPEVFADDKKMEPTEPVMGDEYKIKTNVKQSVPVIVSDDKLREANKQCAPVAVDVHKLKAAEKQFSPVLVDDNELKAKEKQSAPDEIVENNQSIINKMSNKDETSEQLKNIENVGQPRRLSTKEILKSKKGSVPLPDIICDKAKDAMEVQNNNNRHFIMIDENSSLTKQRAVDVHPKKVTVNDTVFKVTNPKQHKNLQLNQTPTVSNLINNSNSANENILCKENNDDVIIKDNNNQNASQSRTGNPDNGQNNEAQFRKEDYMFEEIPINDPRKKCVRIKLPDGKLYKVTVFSKNHIDYDKLFADPAMKNLFTQSLAEGKNYKLNINHTCTTTKKNPSKVLAVKINGIDVIENKNPVVNLISDDEDDDTRTFSTEFGKYNTKIDIATFTKHQKKFGQKCVVKLSNISKRTKPKSHSLLWNTNSLLTRTKSKLLSKEHNLSCIVHDSQRSPNNTKEDLPAVNFKSSEQPIKQAVPTPLILKRVTIDRNLLNTNSEVIEIDDSSNDSIEISTNENVEPVKKIIEFKSLLLQDLGVAGSENVPIKENVLNSDNIVAVENLKNALLKDFGVAETTKKLHDNVTEQKGSKNDPIKSTVLLMKECLVKVSKCDDLVKKHDLIKRAKECFVLLQRCDVLPVKADSKLHEISKEKEAEVLTVDCGENFIDFDVEEDSISPKLSRWPSLSILNLWEDTICQPTTESLYGRSSPVMEIFEALSFLYNKCMPENILEEKVQLLPLTCCSEWVMTKMTCRIQEMAGFSHQQDTKAEEIINTCDYNPEINEENAVFIFKAPKLVTIALKCLENPDVVYRLHVARDDRKKPLKSPSNKLKRKTETSDDKVASKILKLGTLTLKAINTYDEHFFGTKIAKTEEVNVTLDVTQNVINDRSSSIPEFITEANKYTERIQYKNQNSPSGKDRHVNQNEENGICLSTQKIKSTIDSNVEKSEQNENMSSKDTLECVVRIIANDSNVSLGIVANTEVEKESEEYSKTDNYEIPIYPEKTNKDCDLDTSLNRENYSKTYSDLEDMALIDVSLIHEHCAKNTSDDCNEVYIESNGPSCTLQMELNSGEKHSLTSKSTEEKDERNEKMKSKDTLQTKLSEPTCVGQAFVSIVSNNSNVSFETVTNTEVENKIVKKESEEYSKTANYEIQIQPAKTSKDCDLDVSLNRENHSKTYSDLESKLALIDVSLMHEHCTENASNDCNEVNIERNRSTCTLQMKLKSGEEHALTSKSSDEKAERNEKMVSMYTLQTKLSEPTCVGQAFVSIVANDSNVSLGIVANAEVENEIFEKVSEEYSKIDSYEVQAEKTNKDGALDISLNRENYSKTYSDLENKLASIDVSLIHEHRTENTSDDGNEVNIESDGSTYTLQMKLNSEEEYSLTSNSTYVPSISTTDPAVEADPIECTDTEIISTVEDLINCLLQRCDETEKSTNGVCQITEKQKGNSVIANDTVKYPSHDMASEVLKDSITSSVLIDDSKLAIDKSDTEEFENLMPCEDNIDKDSTNKEDFETNSNIIQKTHILNQTDDTPVLLCQSSKEGDPELLQLESKQAVTEIHYRNLETVEEIAQNYAYVNQTSDNTLLCEISGDDIPKEGFDVEIVDTSCEKETEIVENTNEMISCESAAENHDSPITSPLVVDNKEIIFNYHDYIKPPKKKEIPLVNNEEHDNYYTPEDSPVLTDDVSLKISEANTSICDQLKNFISPKIKTEENSDEERETEEPSNNDHTHKTVVSSKVKAKPEFKYEFIQDDDWLTVITTENEKDTTKADTDDTSSRLEVSTEYQEIVSPVSTEGSGVTLKGIEYEDPVMGKCYVFTLNESGSSTSNISSDNLEVFQESDSSQDANEFKDPHLYEDLHNIEFSVVIPKITYSKGSLKRKKNMRDFNVLESKYRKNNERDRKIIEKKYRKGKNIDCPKQTLKSITDSAYAKEFNRLIEYYSSLNFSFSRPFPKEYLDASDMISNWPVSGTYTEIPTDDAGETLFDDLHPTPSYQPDPATQTLAEEITYQYEKSDSLQENQSNEAPDTNFNMGFGEGSGRVIQNLKKSGVSNISAATLSDVKQSQPFLVSEDYDDYETFKTNTDDQLKKIRRYVNFIELRDKVRSFFKKTTVELKSDWIQQNKSKHNDKLVRDFPFDLCSLDYVRPAPSDVVAQVVQVGQLPVSAAAQNPVTCDPRVTQVSDASPSQCSVDNSPNDDSQSEIKTEYTELTTADLTLPLVQEYAQQNQAMNQDSYDVNDIEITEQTISLEMEIKAEERPEIKQELPDISEERSNSADNTDMHTYTNTTPEHVEYSFENNTAKPDGNNVNYDAAEKNNSETFSQQRQQNGTSEKTDQIAHAMNAAGITTTPESINNSRAHALVNILSQKIRQGSVNTTQTATNTYSKTTSINAMSLQQALAQILPPPLNQTGSGENNQTGSTPVGPQVLHIVQGKNASGNQITLVDNSQQSVISNPNATQVLHIVQNKGATGQTSNGTLTSQSNTFSGLSLVDTGLQQGGNQLLHIVNTGNQKNASPGQLLKRVNLLTNLANVQGSNEQKMVQFVCKSADGKAIQLNAPHQRSMVLRLQPIETPNVQTPPAKPAESQDLSPSTTSSASSKEAASQQEIKSRSIYEENYAKFIQNSSSKTPSLEKSTSLPKFNQAFGKPVFQEGNQKQGEAANSNTHIQSVSANNENTDCHATDNAINLEHIGQISSPPLLLRKQPAVTSQSPSNLVQQIKQTISPMNIQTMHGGVIYTRQIPVNIGGGQTINLITVPSTELMNEDTPKQQTASQGDIEPSIIKIVPQSQTATNSEGSQEDNNSHMNSSNENAQNPQPQPVLTQMRIKLPMLSKAPQMVPGARVVRPSFFQIQRNVIGGANQPVYQQLVLTAAPPLGQQTIRLPQTQATRPIKVASESQSSSSESQMSSSTLEQLREFDMVLEQVKERSTVQPGSNSNNNSFKLQTNSSDATDGTGSSNCSNESTQQQVLYSIGNNQSLNVAYVNRKATVTTPTTSTYVRSPDSTGIADSPTSSTHVQIPHTVTTDSSPTETSQPKPAKVGSKSKSRPKSSSNPPNTLKLSSSSVPPKTSSQKPLEDEQTTQRILYILAEYKEQVENSPDKDKPAPRRRSNPPSNPGSSKRKKGSSSRRSGTRDMSPVHGEDTCRTMGSEDSSCGTSQGDCTESCLDSHSPQDSPRKVARKITFDQELPTQARPQPQRNVIVADGQTITVARGATGKPATAVLMPANYILPVSMVKGGQQIAIVTNRGPKLLTVGGEGGAANALLLQRLIGPGGLKPVLTRPGVRHVRLPTAALHNLQAFNLATGAATSVQPPDSTASPTPGPTPPELVDTRATSSPWTDRDEVKPERGSSPEGSEPWHLPSSADTHEYSYEETVRTDNMDRTVLDPIPDRYSPDMEAQRIFDKMFDVDAKKSYAVGSHDDSPRCAYDIDASDCDDKAYQVVQKKDGSQRQHRLSHVSAAALRHKYAILEHELRLQKSLSEECEDLGVDSPSASELFPEAELLFATSPAHDHNHDQHHSHTPQPLQSAISQPDMDDQIATDHLIPREIDVSLGLSDVGIVAVSEDGMQATIALDQEEFARSHPNTTFHSEPTDAEVQPFTITGIKGRHITSTIFHSNSAPATVLMAAPQATVISQAPESVKYEIENMISMPSSHNNDVNLSSVLVKDDGLTRFDGILTDSRELHLTNTTSAIVHSSGNATQVIRRVCYEDDKRERDTRFLIDEPDNLIAGDDAKMIAEDSSRDATLESMADVDDDRSSPERHAELFWESNSASERSEGRRPLDFSSDSDKCCKSPSFDETNSTDSSGVGTHMRLDSVIKEARGRERSGSADGSSADDTHPPLRTYPPKRLYHPMEGEAERSLSGKTRAGERSPDSLEVRRRASGRGVVKRGCHCCNGSPAPPRPKKPRQRKPTLDFNSTN